MEGKLRQLTANTKKMEKELHETCTAVRRSPEEQESSWGYAGGDAASLEQC